MNKRIQRFAGAAAAAAAAAAVSAAFCSGCESADSYAISVKPGDATVSSAAPSVALTASGWSDYQWSLSDTSLGYLSSSKGQSVVYTARSGTFAGGRQTVTVTAVGSGYSGGSSTNSASGGYTAQAIVTHRDETVAEQPADEETPQPETEIPQTPETPTGQPTETPSLSLSLSAEPKSLTTTNGVVWITASVKDDPGGVSYKWGVNIGSLSRTTGDTTMYSPPTNAVNGQVASVSCTATCDGYKEASKSVSIPFKFNN